MPSATGPTHFRAHARLRVELDGTLSLAGGRAPCEVRVRDLGMGGAGIELDPVAHVDFALEAPVTLALRAPTRWDALELSGRVAWSRAGDPGRPARVGVCFEDTDEPRLLALFELLGEPAR